MVTASGVKLLDFGLAKSMDVGKDVTVTGTGTVLGTVAYMSPEQARGCRLDARSDIFSFGAVLYEMLSGTRAFSGTTTPEVLSAVLRDDPPPLWPSSPLEPVVRKCLAKQPGDRFQTMDEVLDALRSVVMSPTEGGALDRRAAVREHERRRRQRVLQRRHRRGDHQRALPTRGPSSRCAHLLLFVQGQVD